jgi:hypothetical protein
VGGSRAEDAFMDTDLSGLERLAARQHGIVVLWQLAALGLRVRTFRAVARRHGWVRLDEDVWAAPWSQPSFARACAIEINRGPRARLLTGEAELQLLGVRRGPAPVTVWLRPGLAAQRRPGVRYKRTSWVPGDRIIRVERMPAMPPLRALRDAVPHAGVDRIVKDLQQLDRLRLATPEQAAAALERWGRFAGRPRFAAAVERVLDGLTHSQSEARARRLLAGVRPPPHPRPLLVTKRSWKLGEVDIAFCGVRYGVEVDGPPHLRDGAADQDAVRDAALLREADWEIDRFPGGLLDDDPDGFVERVVLGLRVAAARDVEPWPCSACRAAP